MALDPMQMIRTLRQGAAEVPDMSGVEIRPATGRGGRLSAAELNEIPMGPGDPGWYSKIPPPEPLGVDAVPTSPPAAASAPPATSGFIAQATPPAYRIGVYYGRGEGYNLIVEQAPDWDNVEVWRLQGSEVMLVLGVCRTLGITIADKTGEFGRAKHSSGGGDPPARGDPGATSDGQDNPAWATTGVVPGAPEADRAADGRPRGRKAAA